MPLDLVGLGDDLEQALGELRGHLALISSRDVQDREFVAAEAGDGVALAHQALQSRRHRLEQRVAYRMSERVVDRLEQVEIEDENRVSDAGRLVAFERGVRLLAKQHPIGDIGQGIVARQVGDSPSLRCRSVTSSCVATQPPPATSSLATSMMRPSASS